MRGHGVAKFPAWSASLCVLWIAWESPVPHKVAANVVYVPAEALPAVESGSAIIAISTPLVRLIEETV
jgi:hypothetical protein